jgi:hypothetical protein
MCDWEGAFHNRFEQVLGTRHNFCFEGRNNLCLAFVYFFLSIFSLHGRFSGGAIPQGKEWIHQCDSSAECLNKNGERFYPP